MMMETKSTIDGCMELQPILNITSNIEIPRDKVTRENPTFRIK